MLELPTINMYIYFFKDTKREGKLSNQFNNLNIFDRFGNSSVKVSFLIFNYPIIFIYRSQISMKELRFEWTLQ